MLVCYRNKILPNPSFSAKDILVFTEEPNPPFNCSVTELTAALLSCSLTSDWSFKRKLDIFEGADIYKYISTIYSRADTKSLQILAASLIFNIMLLWRYFATEILNTTLANRDITLAARNLRDYFGTGLRDDGNRTSINFCRFRKNYLSKRRRRNMGN